MQLFLSVMEKELSLSEMIENVKKQNKSGQVIVKEQIEYLRSLKDLLADGVE